MDIFIRFGSSTVVIARFVPVVRTLAPFLAGAGSMPYLRFAMFNVAGAVLWVALLVYAGAFLGAQALVRDHLSAITMGIVALSMLPILVTGKRALLARRAMAR